MKAGALDHLARLVVLALVSTAPAAAATIQVTVDKLVFSPASVDAKVGDTIEWVNKDVIAHTATVKGGWEVVIPPKKSASMTLKTSQTVDYFCRFHPNMKGRLLVAP
ncbi:cupredoxin family copper-binding protein [Mesorhizobium australicum]|jgi:plastocyanin|uniref:Cupredoxin family copper-binding protein n=1 Tax=Mesorhizobium australicum TaxID=536018 RepID=A0ACC6T3G8_9HYPH|nr:MULTISPECIES: cupredoxin family copper-binding protein [unclassified Mesorhizobium]ESY85584.1 amicyanin [Mesorhizobium sp. LNHC220B00]ESY91769.1 amicyanin [Mesorhizobium sp. LNHC229A00]ESY95577.1 amicyanin [Mesorhizobium sp. LNHC209A00]